jgi:tRNA threonylcarbamoyladenosine biosynthesis protein TsaE
VILETLSLTWPDEAACAATAQALARQPGLRQACITLDGPLGAGKTTWVRHLLRALGVGGRIKSPSYAIVEPYELPAADTAADATADAAAAPGDAWHFDFYRFGDPREWEDAGFRDLFASPGLKLVEWPERATGLMPPPDLAVTLAFHADEGREVRLDAHTPRGVALLRGLSGGPVASAAPGWTA